MKSQATSAVVTFSAGIALALPCASIAVPDDCYVQSSYPVSGGCFQWAQGDCQPCCRENHLAMDVPIVASGNVYGAYCDDMFYYDAEVRFCPGTPPNECTLLTIMQCSHYADGSVVLPVACPQEH